LKFDVQFAVLFGAVAALIIFFLLLVLDNHFHGLGTNFPGGLIGAIGAVLAIGIGGEVFMDRPHSEKIAFIKIGETKQYTTVLVKKYSSSGDRNIDEDDLLRLIEILEDLNPTENEVRDNPKGLP